MALYGQYVLFVDGILLANCTAIESELTSDDQEVMTVVLGWAGLSPSPDVRRFTISNVSPVAGEDYEFEQAKLNRTNLELKFQQVGSGKSLISKGYIMRVQRSGGVGQTVTVGFDFVGTPSAPA